MSKFLIVGLGNIGNEYTDTRHNIGFNVVDTLANQLKVNFTLEKLAMYANGTYKGKQIHIIKPTTYMNLSGKAIKYWAEFLKIDLENVLVTLDDLALPFGTLRLKSKGSDAGHNGLRSIQTELQTQNYPRLRFGIGDNFQKGKNIARVILASGGSPQHIQAGDYDVRQNINNGMDYEMKRQEEARKKQETTN